MSSPRKRASLSLAASSSSTSSTALPRPTAKAARSAASLPYAARDARFVLTEARRAMGLTPAQFSQALNSHTDGRGTSVKPDQILRMEEGFALVPMHVLSAADALQSAHQQQEAEQNPSDPPEVGGSYPYQEPMEGSDYQIPPPRFLGVAGGPKALNREGRKDELVYAPQSASSSGVKIDTYIAEVRSLIEGSGVGETGALRFNEEVAVSILHELNYDASAALASLRMCLLHQRTSAATTDASSSASTAHSSAPGPAGIEPPAPNFLADRVATANSILWLQRLREAGLHLRWSDGECEALDAGVAEHGKELATLHRHVLREKSLPELIELYYVAGARHQSP